MKGSAIRYMVVDAEAHGRARIKKYMDTLGNDVFIAECGQASKAMEVLFEREVDLMFLNTNLPDLDTMNFLGALKDATQVILTSGSSKYAQEAFERDVVDYLKEPFTFDRFFKAVNKFRLSIDQDIQLSFDCCRISNDSFIYVEGRDKVVKIRVNDICFAESVLNQLRIHTEQGQFISHSHFGHLEQALSSWPFTKINKDLLISLNKIRSFSSTTVDIGHTSLNISRNYRDQFFSALGYDKDLLN